MYKVILYGLLAVVFIACGNGADERKDGFSENEKSPEDSLFQDVMDGHDEAMAKINKIKGYRKQFEKAIDSLKDVKSGAKEKLSRAYEDVSERLKDAEEEMDKWMHEFSIDSAQDDVKRRLEYLQSEKIKVEKVKERIFSALNKADSLTGK